jgi:arylsulfatase A-like enzyme
LFNLIAGAFLVASKKRLVFLPLVVLYLTAMALSLVLLYQPDLRIFYHRMRVAESDIFPMEQEFKIYQKLGLPVYDPQTIRLFEGAEELTRTSVEQTRAGTRGSYAVEKLTNSTANVFFVPQGGEEGFSGFDQLTILVKPYLFTSNNGGLLFVALATLLMVGLFFYSKNKKAKKKVQPAPVSKPEGFRTNVKERFDISKRWRLIRNGMANAALIAYLYILLEWLYYVTNPSFMDVIQQWEKVKVCAINAVFLALVLAATFPILYVIDTLVIPRNGNLRKFLYQIPAAFLATFLCFSLLDNITYVYLNFGIVDAKLIVRAVYALFFVVLFLVTLNAFSISTKQIEKRKFLKVKEILAGVLAIFSIVMIGMTYTKDNSTTTTILGKQNKADLPNIIMLATDGLSAEHMSVYGYERNTTPFMLKLSGSSLVAENNFTNATTSMGSETSILTGKSPFATRVIYTPDTLRGSDMYQSLPNVLKQYGYRTASLGVEYFVDVNAVDFRDAFDEVNCHNNGAGEISSVFTKHGFENEVKFFNLIQKKIGDRLLHIVFIRDMKNTMADVTEPITFTLSDEEKAKCLLSYLDTAKETGQPLFVQAHLMGTHGPTFNQDNHTFSKDEEQSETWMTDFYDDAILNYDAIVRTLVQHLKENGQYENTVLILYTDHPQQWVFNERIPLIIHFPKDQYSGTIQPSTQNLDIAPTIVDYLNLISPYELSGNSILKKLDPNRLIIAGIPQYYEVNSGILSIPEDAYKPPFYQFIGLTVVQCQKTYLFDLEKIAVKEGEIENYVNPCDPATLDSVDEIKEEVGWFLRRNGFALPKNW